MAGMKTFKITTIFGSALCIALLLVSCMKQATVPFGADAAGIEGIHWHLTEVGGSPVSPMADDKQPHILLDPAQKQATGFAGCNNFFGSYELDGSSLTPWVSRLEASPTKKDLPQRTMVSCGSGILWERHPAAKLKH